MHLHKLVMFGILISGTWFVSRSVLSHRPTFFVLFILPLLMPGITFGRRYSGHQLRVSQSIRYIPPYGG